ATSGYRSATFIASLRLGASDAYRRFASAAGEESSKRVMTNGRRERSKVPAACMPTESRRLLVGKAVRKMPSEVVSSGRSVISARRSIARTVGMVRFDVFHE